MSKGVKNMTKKIHMKPEVIQKFNWGGTTKEWEDEAHKLSNQLETMEAVNFIIENQDCGSEIKKPPIGDNE
jgi:Cu/Ag efflux protein CusF